MYHPSSELAKLPKEVEYLRGSRVGGFASSHVATSISEKELGHNCSRVSFLLGGFLLLPTGNLVKRCSCCSGFGLLVNGLGFGFGGINQKVSGCENIFSYDCTVSQSLSVINSGVQCEFFASNIQFDLHHGPLHGRVSVRASDLYVSEYWAEPDFPG